VTIRVFDEYDEVLIGSELAVGDVASIAGWGSVWTRGDDGEVEQLSPMEHSEFVTVGSLYGWHPDEGSADDATYGGPLGHVLGIYFAFWYDDWIWLGSAPSADDALDLLRDWLGVLDPSWIFLQP
jgi:hypothetical protein